jgi:hypothetical protein
LEHTCKCGQCAGWNDFTRNDTFMSREFDRALGIKEVEIPVSEPQEEPLSVYEKLQDFYDKLVAVGNISPDLLNELADITEEIDMIDDEVVCLKTDIEQNGIEYGQVQLGQISKRLY